MKFLHTLTKGGLLVALLLLCNFAMAQRTVKGKVTDADGGDALIGASVSVVGTTRGTATDVDGNYSIEVPEGSTQIRFAYTGYSEQVVTLSASNIVNVSMKAGSVLDEVVVIGYGSVKKSDLTGSVVSVNEKDFNQGLVTAPDQLIQGKAAGVQVLNNSGQPGGATTVRIRGNSSIRAGNQPLFVVDGVQLTGNSTKPGFSDALGNSPASNPLNYLNPSDIENIQVLKDASATAIYGSRGANGVIMITTKKAKSGLPSIQFNTSVGMSSILNKYKVLDASEYRSQLRAYNLPVDTATGRINGDYGGEADAFGEILRTGITQNHGLTVSGGSDMGSYRIGVNYLNQEGIIKSNDLRRLSTNISGSYKFFESKRLALDFGIIASQTKENAPSIATNSDFRGSLIGNALQWNPTDNLYNADGTPVILPKFGNFTNPVALIDAYKDRVNTIDIIANISPSYKITDDLIYKFSYALTHGTGTRRAQIARWINLQNIENRGVAFIGDEANTNQILTHTLNYNTNISSGISVNAVVGYEYQKLTEKGFGIVGRDFLIGDFDYTNIMQNSTAGSRNVFSYATPDAELQSYFVRGIFNVRDKYLLTATMRADGSSKFGENNKYGYFPAIGAAWNIQNEDFLQDGAFQNLKLRIGWGKTGNSEFPAGASLDRYAFGQQSISLENVANPDLKWETTTTFNVGLDFAILKGKVSGTVEYFNRNTTDLLFQFNTIQPAPAGRYWINLPGNVINSGVEVTANVLAVDNGKFSWNIGGNVAFMKNTLENYVGPVIDYGGLFGQGSSGATSQRFTNGQPLNSFYLRHHEGLDTAGLSKYTLNEDGSEALFYAGDPNPDVLLGISTSLAYNKLSLGLNFNGAFGHQLFNNTKMSVIPITNLGTRNIDANLVGGSTQESTANAIKASDRYLESGNYLKLANATLAYNIGNIGKSVKNAYVYLTGSNLLVFTNYTGFDPEVNTINEEQGLPSTGIEYIPYPSARTFILGANFSF